MDTHESKECLKEATNCLLFPRPHQCRPMQTNYTVATYLSDCKENILAEIWSWFQSSVKPMGSGWRDRCLKPMHMQMFEDSVVSLTDRQGNTVDIAEFAWNIFLVEDRWCLLKVDRERSTAKIKEGTSFHDPGYMPELKRAGAQRVHLVGYAKSYIHDLVAVLNAQQSAQHPAILQAIAEVNGNFPFQFRKEISGEIIPINDRQADAVTSMRRRVEGIQGPPGTGKSTTIYHIAHGCIPLNHRAIIVCIQNKALESIVLKLQQDKDLIFIVYGNPDRLSSASKDYTLDAWVIRDAKVVACMDRADKLEAITQRMEIDLYKNRNKVRGLGRRHWRKCMQAIAESTFMALQMDIESLRAEYERTCTDLDELIETTRERYINQCRAFVSTVDSVYQIEVRHPAVLVIDEAGVMPDYKMPFLVLSNPIQAVVAIGDQNQLTAFSYAENFNSFFHRLTASRHVPMLIEQYRMHPTICDMMEIPAAWWVQCVLLDDTVNVDLLASAGADQIPCAGWTNAKTPGYQPKTR
ncbi:hypothetical protein GUITHDRAFT_120150 [Guillardia theta CCMP2712]|uniref:DNA2/NAM7 helicase helicase domain-containing protein n=1 Tax=Guillardia theta (strain CCMP2712) TaxID=905079 RepID=L1ICR5_GUITC|nr:hypothetical protein GUITHDRAFT_120150 [Guillardia theta CCMP2712]EKX33630.1 hypothetical protein GUITHDRAFT_120150 [Guillardia theta CCMP2712]|eukprot:XP_005820610.1 hypothetical protein GUITHDRAFT_120150 [Guillardia theta CCMP2712]